MKKLGNIGARTDIGPPSSNPGILRPSRHLGPSAAVHHDVGQAWTRRPPAHRQDLPDGRQPRRADRAEPHRGRRPSIRTGPSIRSRPPSPSASSPRQHSSEEMRRMMESVVDAGTGNDTAISRASRGSAGRQVRQGQARGPNRATTTVKTSSFAAAWGSRIDRFRSTLWAWSLTASPQGHVAHVVRFG